MDASATELRQRSVRSEAGLPPVPVTLLMRLGHVDPVRQHAAAGDWNCASALATAAVERGEADAAVDMLLPFAETGVWTAIEQTARALAAAGRFDEALALASTEPDDRELAARLTHSALKLQAELLVAAGRRTEAFELLRPHAEHWMLTRPWIAAAEGLGRDAEVAELLAEMAAAGPRAMVRELTEVLTRSGRIGEAEALLRSRLVHDGKIHTDLVHRLVDLLVAQEREDAVREVIDGPAGRFAAEYFAEILEKRGDRDAALATLAPFSTADSNSRLAHGRMLLRAGRLPEATELLLALDDTVSHVGLNTLCTDLAERGRHAQALALIDDAADQAGGMSTGLLRLRAATLAHRGDVDQAIAELRAHPHGDGDATTAAIDSAALLARAGRLDEAVGVLAPLSDTVRWASLKCSEAMILLGRVEEGIGLALKWKPLNWQQVEQTDQVA